MIHCTFENGNKAYLRHVVVHALILQDNKVLLVKRSKQIIEGGKWALVGGYVEHDETVREAVEREIMEETGYKVANITQLWINDNPKRPNENNRQNIAFVFYCDALEKVGKSDWEVDEQRWFSFDALPDTDTIAFDHILSIQKYLNLPQKSTLDKV